MHYAPGKDDGRYLLPHFDIDRVPPEAYPSVVRGSVLTALVVVGLLWVNGLPPSEYKAWLDDHTGRDPYVEQAVEGSYLVGE